MKLSVNLPRKGTIEHFLGFEGDYLKSKKYSDVIILYIGEGMVEFREVEKPLFAKNETHRTVVLLGNIRVEFDD